MRNLVEIVGCIIRWGGGGGAMLGALLYALYLSVVTFSDILRIGGLPYYDPIYIVLGLLVGALLGFILGIVAALVNSAGMVLLIATFRIRRKSASVPRRTLTVMFTVVSGVGMLLCCVIMGLPTAGWLVVGWSWLLGAVIPAILAAFWAWRVGGKAPIIAY